MVNIIQTGSKTVDAIGHMNLSGNVTPQNWYRTILRENGKPYLLAICILSEICYWYRPKEIRDERTGFVVEYRKRFSEDYLQKSYQQLADLFGETKRSVKAAMDALEELGVITRIWRNKKYKSGAMINNILYVALNEERLYEITYGNFNSEKPENDSVNDEYFCDKDVRDESCEDENEEKSAENPVNIDVTKFCNMPLQNFVGGPTTKRNMVLQNNVGGPTKECNIIPQNNAGGLTKKCRTNTEITIETTNEKILSNQIISDEVSFDFDTADVSEKMDMARVLLKSNVYFDNIPPEEFTKRQKVEELIEIMAEVIAYGQDVTISGKVIPYQVIRSRFEKYNDVIMDYVLDTLSQNTTKVRNIRKYLLATLYNAPTTVDSYYELLVNHDMNQIDWRDKTDG